MKKTKLKLFAIFSILIILNSIVAYAEETSEGKKFPLGWVIGGVVAAVALTALVVVGLPLILPVAATGLGVFLMGLAAAPATWITAIALGGIGGWVSSKSNGGEGDTSTDVDDSGSTDEQPTAAPEQIPDGTSTGSKFCWPAKEIYISETDTPDFCKNEGFPGYNPKGPYYVDSDKDGKGTGGEIFFCCGSGFTEEPGLLEAAQQHFALNDEDEDDSPAREEPVEEESEIEEPAENAGEITGCILDIGGNSESFNIGELKVIDGNDVTLIDVNDVNGCKVQVGVNFKWVTIGNQWDFNEGLTIKVVSIEKSTEQPVPVEPTPEPQQPPAVVETDT
ncbi:hypothetical protein HN827_05455 [archaeon]|nr:hypothetical protein [archaeon]MBT6821841.1 hypothetical protein [archaeon]MBT7392251.1 hypothetical protein [archaeon]